MKIIFILLLIPGVLLAQAYKYPVPKDPANTPIYGGLGLPVHGESVTLTTTSYADVLTVPSTGNDINRQYRHICSYNPSTTLEVRLCFGTACSSPQMVIPAGMGLCLDHTYFGVFNDITVIRGALSGAGSVVPKVTIW